jgi:fucose permease
VLGGSAVTAAGFALFWSSPLTWLAAVGLFVTGTGVALMYPATLSRLVAAWPHDRNAAAGLGALASGAAIGIPPFVLAGLADHVGIRAAYLLVPGLLVLLVLLVLLTARPRRGQPADTSTTPASAETTPTC